MGDLRFQLRRAPGCYPEASKLKWSAGTLTRALALFVVAISLLLSSGVVHSEPLRVDRVVVRFTAPETGGVDAPRFVFERELAFEARLEALADETFQPSALAPYRDIHVRAALERHIAETILESLEVTPRPSTHEIRLRANGALAALAQRVGGSRALDAAAAAEGIERREVFRMLQRQARASLYLDRMVAPMLTPSQAELRVIHQSGRTPFSAQAYDEVRQPLERWYVSRRLRQALVTYYEGARSRLSVYLVEND